MKEQLVTFETAKLAKEKGFDWPSRSYYENALVEEVHEEDGKSGPFGWEKNELNLQTGFFINNYKDCDYSGEVWFMCSSPTQSLLQKWLREKHDIHLSAFPVVKNRYYFTISKIKEDGIDAIIKGPYDPKTACDTYEQALEKGLIEALKIIQ